MEALNGVLVIFGVIGGGFSLIAIIAVCYVWVRNSADKATIESQGRLLDTRKEEIDDLNRRVLVLEADNRHLQQAVVQVRGIDQVQATADAIKADTSAIRAKMAAA